MRKGLIAIVIAAILLAGAALSWRVLRWRAQETSPKSGGRVSLVSVAEEKALPPLPNISLQINSEHELTEYQGTPLIFTVRLSNPRAVNAEAANQAERIHAEELQARVARGETGKEQASAQLASFRGQHKVKSVVIGDESADWEHFVHVVQVLPGGKQQPSPWSLKLAAPPGTKILTLDAKNTAQLDYLLAPEAMAQLAPGEYQFLVVVEVPSDARIPADRWRGRIESRPVKLTVGQRPARLTPAEEEKMNLQFAQYHKAAGELPAVLEAAQQALAANPHSIFAHILVGEVQEAQGDFQSALESYRAARSEFYAQHPESYEPPVYLLHKISEMSGKVQPNA